MEETPKEIIKEERIEGPNYINIGKFVIVILLVIGLGFLAINQGFKFFYTANLLMHPCKVCQEANKVQANCIDRCFTYQAIQEEQAYLPQLGIGLNLTYP